jgi:alkylation response protein AidB-like acyl-CoA dehydrogenase
MDLGIGAGYEGLRHEVRSFLAARWPPAGIDGRGGPSREQVQAFRSAAVESGYVYRNIPRRYGGSEQPADVLAALVIREEFEAVHAPMELQSPGVTMLVPTLLDRGADWQKERFIRRAIDGEELWCQGYSEPGAGSDLASLRTRAELRDGTWVINGHKIWTSHSLQADFMFALVRTEPDAGKHAGISYLLVPMDQPGIEVRPLKQITGATEFSEVFIDDARTPADWIVGARGEGWSVSRTLLRHERNMVGGASRASGLFQSLVRLARKAEIDGRPAIEDPQVRDSLARIYGYVESQRCSSYVQLTREVNGRDQGLLPLLNKLGGTNIGQEVARVAQQLLGPECLLAPFGQPAGLTSGNEKWTNQVMGSLGLAIAGGASNIQRNIIAERGLGLPKQDPA